MHSYCSEKLKHYLCTMALIMMIMTLMMMTLHVVVVDDDDALANGTIACLRLHSNPIFPGVHKIFTYDDDDDDDYDDGYLYLYLNVSFSLNFQSLTIFRL